MSEPRKTISEEEEMSILREYYASGKGINEFVSTCGYEFLNQSTLLNWINRCGFKNKDLSLRLELLKEEMARRSKEQIIREKEALAKRVKELEKALEIAHLETKARDIMIDLAEERFEIPIRKKSGAKQ